MEKAVKRFINTHQLIKRNTTVLIGVSGGPDSVALLHVLVNMRETWNLKLIALAIDHQLRGKESIADIDYVEAICAKWNVTFVRTARDVNVYKEVNEVGTQIAAREVRYQFFEEQMKAHQADYLALGHHGDDQVETMMMRFVRSARSNALTGIPIQRPFATGLIVRPLLSVTKAEILAYCDNHGIIPRIDPSNEDPTYTRNYFRKYIIPLVRERNNNIHTTMQHLSESLQADEDYLQSEAAKMFKDLQITNKETKKATFEINVFKSYPLSLQRRCYHLILEYLYPDIPENITYVHEGIFFSLLADTHGNGQVDFPDGLLVERSYQLISLYFKEQTAAEYNMAEVIQIPGEVKLADGASLKAFHTDAEQARGKYSLTCDLNKLALPLHIRTRQPGDRMNWKGLDGSKKIKDVFIDLKIPRKDRDSWPIVTDNNGEILWLVGLRKSAQAIYTEGTIHIQLEYEKAEG